MTALQWITTEAKKLKKQSPTKYATWREYVSAASALYKKKATAHKAPAKKVSGVKDANKQHQKELDVSKKVNAKYKNWQYPVPPVYTGNWDFKAWSNWIEQNGQRISGVSTKSKSHTDKNRITANIQVGSLHHRSIGSVKGLFKSMADLRAKNKAAGFYFFSPATMKFFKSKIESSLIGGRYFITSEMYGPGNKVYNVRMAEADGSIKTVGNDYSSKEAAKNVILKLR